MELLPERLRVMMLVTRFEILQQSQGLQAAVLLDGPDIVADSEKMLRMTTAAFEFLDQPAFGRFLERLVPAVSEHLTRLVIAEQEDRLDEFVSPLDQDETWMAMGFPYIHELRNQVGDHAEDLIFPQT